MSNRNLNLPVVIGKAAVAILGIPVLVLGLYSHFESSWSRNAHISWNGSGLYGISSVIKLYKVCGLKNKYPSIRFQTCPSISLEHYFISMIIICFILSLVSLIAELMSNMQDSRIRKLIDGGYHCMAAVMLLVAGIVYIVSAVQIDSFLANPVTDLLFDDYEFLKGEKIAAGALTMVQAFLYGAVTILILRSELPQRFVRY